MSYEIHVQRVFFSQMLRGVPRGLTMVYISKQLKFCIIKNFFTCSQLAHTIHAWEI